jgi:hypothetical protein
MNAISAKTRDRLLYMISPLLFLALWQLLLMAGLGDRRFIPANGTSRSGSGSSC